MAMRSERHIVPVTGTDIARFLNQKKASPSKQASALASKNTRSSTITSTSSITEETGEKKALKGGKVKNIPQDFRRFTYKSGHDFHVVPTHIRYGIVVKQSFETIALTCEICSK